jgi:hypothetical protein
MTSTFNHIIAVFDCCILEKKCSLPSLYDIYQQAVAWIFRHCFKILMKINNFNFIHNLVYLSVISCKHSKNMHYLFFTERRTKNAVVIHHWMVLEMMSTWMVYRSLQVSTIRYVFVEICCCSFTCLFKDYIQTCVFVSII